jgi:L-ascorbate metabolism protein UlaG (beta-lactamase superfamily)
LWPVLVVVALLAVGGTLRAEDTAESATRGHNWELYSRQRIKNSPNYYGGRFVNELPTDLVKIKELWSVLGEQLAPSADRQPEQLLPVVDCCSEPPAIPSLRAYWLGHASVLLEMDGVRVLFDPVFDDSVQHAAGFAYRFHRLPIARDSLPSIDLVIISHDHYDHLERSSVLYFATREAKFVVPLGVKKLLVEWGAPPHLVADLDWWESFDYEALKIVCTPARHYSGRSISQFDRSLWASWTVVGPDSRVFYGGDTGYSDHFERVGNKYGPFDLTILPIGAYDDAWPDIHIRPEEAVVAQQALRGKLLLPIHWGTFDLSTHPWDEPIKRLVSFAADENLRVATPMPGESVTTDSTVDFARWWEGLD